MHIAFRQCSALLILTMLLAALPTLALADTITVTEVTLQDTLSEAPPPEVPGVVEALFGAEALETRAIELASGQQVLSLDDALRRALADHPGIAALRREYQAMQSEAFQQGRKPNPAVEVELEEFGGTQEATGVKALATHLTYSQSLERGGKRSLREATARLEGELVQWDIAELEYEIRSAVRMAYAEAQSSRYELEQLGRYRQLVQHIYDTVAASVEAGRSARLELERLDIELARLDLQIGSAERSSELSLRSLATAMGISEPDFDAVDAGDGAGPDLLELSELEQVIEGLPAVARFDAEYDALNALLSLENANSVSDLELFGGISRLNEIQETVFKVGVAWELPVHDKNEGGINAAYHRREQVQHARDAARLDTRMQLSQLHAQATLALANYRDYGRSLLPSANEALALTEEGYHYGKFGLLDVLDAQRTVLELESEQTAALVEYRLAVAEIESLLDMGMADWAGPSGERDVQLIEIRDEPEPQATEENDNE
ncbi:MAG: TolC family protein [Planctomycetales bacterium]|nr:TolC family protein [bacterium]UNM08694.1 MAG: TolC family protein [Planctomycetales bacterium]